MIEIILKIILFFANLIVYETTNWKIDLKSLISSTRKNTNWQFSQIKTEYGKLNQSNGKVNNDNNND